MEAAVAQAAARVEQASAGLEKATAEFGKRQTEVLDALQKQSSDLLARVASQIETAAKAQLERINAELQATQRGVNDTINRTFGELDKALQQELTKALEALGGRLAAVTNAFAQDFSKAIDDLRRAAQAAQDRTRATVR